MSENQDEQKLSSLDLNGTEVTAQRIVVEDFVCSAFIGVTDEERAQPQRLAICAELELIARPPVADDIDEVLSYGKVVGLLRKISARPHFKLLETLAETLAASFFAFPQVTATKLRIEKLERYADVAAVGIEIARRRSA